jgi:hypothetical protein
MRCRFVRPELVTLTLPEGDTLIVKRRLTAGEQRDSYARMYAAGRVNPLQTGIAMVCAYLVDWSLVGLDGTVVPIRGLSVSDLESVLNSLDPVDFVEIKDAIEQHEKRITAERDEQKKTSPTGINGAEMTSLSPYGPAGESTGSEPSTPTTTGSLLTS